MGDKPASITQYLDFNYSLGNFVQLEDLRIGRIKAHHCGECAIIVEFKDGSREKINVNPGVDVFAPDGYDPLNNRFTKWG